MSARALSPKTPRVRSMSAENLLPNSIFRIHSEKTAIVDMVWSLRYPKLSKCTVMVASALLSTIMEYYECCLPGLHDQI
jgi:hypothetical protein